MSNSEASAVLSSPLPVPMDDPSAHFLAECPPLSWGILGCGRVAHDFCVALRRHVPTARIVACATSSSTERAQEFASKHGIEVSYGSYTEMAANEDIQIVYVANVHSFRRKTVEMCLQHDKHVLVEKPLACCTADGEYLVALAQLRKRFLLEGMWTRFFPAVTVARQMMETAAEGAPESTDDVTIGLVQAISSDFHFNATDSEVYPNSFVYNRKLGGGATLLVGPYPVAASCMADNTEPDEIRVVGQVDQPTGVDLQVAVTLAWNNKNNNKTTAQQQQPACTGTVAVAHFGLTCESEERTVLVGNKGRIIIESPGHCPMSLTVQPKVSGRGATGTVQTFHYPLPQPETDDALDYFYPNSAGFCYEAAAVARCIAAGKTEAPQYTQAESLTVLRILEKVRQELGVKSIYDD